METQNSPPREDPLDRSGTARQGLVYVVPAAVPFHAGPQVGLNEISEALRSARLSIIAFTCSVLIGAVLYSVLADEWFRAETVIAPSNQNPSVSPIGGTLTGLAALAGVSVGDGNESLAVAILESRDFARAFIEDEQLLPILFSDEWSVVDGIWRDTDASNWPSVWDGVEMFHDVILKVSRDRQTSLVTLSVDWTDPDQAATWANSLVERLNKALRDRAIREADGNIAYLQSQLSIVTQVSLQQSIGRLLDAEMQKLMIARGNEQFAYTVVDPAVSPVDHVRPNRPLIIVTASFLALIVSSLVVLVRYLGRTRA